MEACIGVGFLWLVFMILVLMIEQVRHECKEELRELKEEIRDLRAEVRWMK